MFRVTETLRRVSGVKTGEVWTTQPIEMSAIEAILFVSGDIHNMDDHKAKYCEIVSVTIEKV